MNTPLQETFSYLRYLITAEIARDTAQIVLTSPPGTPAPVLSSLLAACVAWCDRGEGFRASGFDEKIYVSVPLAYALDRHGLNVFLSDLTSLLAHSAVPQSEETAEVDGVLIKLLLSRIKESGAPAIQLLPAGNPPPSITDALFLRAHLWTVAYGERDASMGFRCLRLNGVVTCAALPGRTVTPEIIEDLRAALNAQKARTAAAATGHPRDGEEPELALA